MRMMQRRERNRRSVPFFSAFAQGGFMLNVNAGMPHCLATSSVEILLHPPQSLLRKIYITPRTHSHCATPGTEDPAADLAAPAVQPVFAHDARNTPSHFHMSCLQHRQSSFSGNCASPAVGIRDQNLESSLSDSRFDQLPLSVPIRQRFFLDCKQFAPLPAQSGANLLIQQHPMIPSGVVCLALHDISAPVFRHRNPVVFFKIKRFRKDDAPDLRIRVRQSPSRIRIVR